MLIVMYIFVVTTGRELRRYVSAASSLGTSATFSTNGWCRDGAIPGSLTGLFTL